MFFLYPSEVLEELFSVWIWEGSLNLRRLIAQQQVEPEFWCKSVSCSRCSSLVIQFSLHIGIEWSVLPLSYWVDHLFHKWCITVCHSVYCIILWQWRLDFCNSSAMDKNHVFLGHCGRSWLLYITADSTTGRTISSDEIAFIQFCLWLSCSILAVN